MRTFDAAILGIVEGITEYLPISSTGHLILTQKLLGITESESAKVFAIAIQLGAIASVIVLYWNYFLEKIKSLSDGNKVSQRFFFNLGIAFLPVGLVGFLFGNWIKATLFDPMWVLAALVVGGVLMIVVEFLLKSRKVHRSIEELTHTDAFIVGCCQIASLWPGFSRAMATILGGRFVGLNAKDSSEFSFFLAIPTLGIATLYQMIKALRSSAQGFDSAWWTSLGVGMLVSFVTATVVIKVFLVFLRKYPIAIFGYYRIVLAIGLYFLLK